MNLYIFNKIMIEVFNQLDIKFFGVLKLGIVVMKLYKDNLIIKGLFLFNIFFVLIRSLR